jgi:hypothetical protein
MTQQFQGLNSMTEYLASQYADDTSLTLEDSLWKDVYKYLINLVTVMIGLRANLDKTQAVWFGS